MTAPTKRRRKTAQTQDRARRAVTEFRKLQPTLTAYARNLTGKKDVRVEMSVKSNGHTDGNKIFMKPPVALGDAALMRHDRFLCDKRDDETLQQTCPACRIRERILAVIYHEIAHIAFDSFLPTTRTDADTTLKIIEAVFPEWYYKRVKAKFDRDPEILYGKKDYAVLAHTVNPYFAFLVNALEDVRINERMSVARPGTRVMQAALLLDAAINGVEQKDKKTGQTVWTRWSEYPTNHQITLAAMCLASGMKIQPDWFEERVYQDAQDAELNSLLVKVHKLPGPGAIYQHCFPIYMRLRDLGYFQLTDEEPPPEPEPQPEPEPEESQDDGEVSDVPQSSDESGSDGSPDEDGSGGPGESGDGPDAPGAPSDSDSGDQAGGSDNGSPEGEDPGGEGEDDGGDSPDGRGGSDDQPDRNPGTAERGAGGPDDADAGNSSGGASDTGGDQDGAEGSSEPGSDLGGSEDHEGDEPGREGDHRDGRPGSGSDRGDEPGDPARPAGQGEPSADPAVDGGEAERDGSDEAGAGGSHQVDAEPGDQDSGSTEAQDSGLEQDSGDQPFDREDGAESSTGDDTSEDLGERGPGSDDGRGTDATADSEVSADGGLSDQAADGCAGADQEGTVDAGTEAEELQSEVRDTEPERAEDSDAVDGDRAIDDTDEVLDYLPDAEQAVDLTDRELKHPPVPPTISSDEDLTLIELGVHVEVDEGDDGGEVMEKAVESAIIQSIYFEMPSSNIPGLKVWKYDNRYEDAVNRPWHSWEGDRYSERSAYKRGQVIDPVGEQYLGPALMRMRVVFSDNQRAKRNRNQRSGRIDTRTLGKRGWSGDDRLFGKKVLPGKKDYFVAIFLDISGSTVGQNIKMIKEAALAQAELCHRMGINFSVYGHTGSWVDATEIYGDPWVDLYEVKAPEQPWDDKSREALMHLNPSMANLDGHTLEFARKLCDQQPQTNKVILYYSDGAMPLENHDEELEILQREIATCKAKGYTLLGVGVRTDSPSRHGLDTVQIDSSEEVNKVVTHLERYLVA